MKVRETELTEEELRAWYVHMARDDFSEAECRTALQDCAKVLPVEWLRYEYLNLYPGEL